AFPTVDAVGDDIAAWRRAPLARMLPDRWLAVVQAGGRAVIAVAGANIQRDLAVGPDPKDDAAAVPGDQPPIGAGERGMVDFSAAEQCGMGLRIPIPAPTLAAGIETLFVFGVAQGSTSAEGADQLGQLLDAQHYTDGLEFMRFGTPSNNTTAERSGYGV